MWLCPDARDASSRLEGLIVLMDDVVIYLPNDAANHDTQGKVTHPVDAPVIGQVWKVHGSWTAQADRRASEKNRRIVADIASRSRSPTGTSERRRFSNYTGEPVR